ncbi:MAG: DNA recombination protein RmuC [Bacteroidaceae bacterium]|nr:DNA recombination protein RmuC [Bacteroidaceae bacterium]
MTGIIVLLVIVVLAFIGVVVFAISKRKEAQMLKTQLESTKNEYEKRILEEKEILKTAKEEYEERLKDERNRVKETAMVILEEQAESLKKKNKEQMDEVVKPISEQLENMKKALDSTREHSTKTRTSIEEHIEMIVKQSDKLSEDARNLTNALKNKGKVQGDWGEQVLEQILESSNMREGTDFEIQGNVKDEDGNNLRPDVVVHCPDGKNIIIDSKVSLTAYFDYVNATTEEEAERAAKANVDSIKKHITELANKNYDKLVKDSVPTVLMFIPNEGSYILAFDKEPNIGQLAYNKGIVLINPTNLMLTIHLVNQMWKNEDRDRNVQEILNTSAALYDKFVTFADTFQKMGNNLQTAQKTYEQGMGQLREGKGNIIHRLEEMKNKGLTTTKKISDSLYEI